MTSIKEDSAHSEKSRGEQVEEKFEQFYNSEAKRLEEDPAMKGRILNVSSKKELAEESGLGGLGKTYETKRMLKLLESEKLGRKDDLALIDLSSGKDRFGFLEEVGINLEKQLSWIIGETEIQAILKKEVNDSKKKSLFAKFKALASDNPDFFTNTLSELAWELFQKDLDVFKKVRQDWGSTHAHPPIVLFFDSLDWLIDEEAKAIRKTVESKSLSEKGPKHPAKDSILDWLTREGGLFDLLLEASVSLVITGRLSLQDSKTWLSSQENNVLLSQIEERYKIELGKFKVADLEGYLKDKLVGKSEEQKKILTEGEFEKFCNDNREQQNFQRLIEIAQKPVLTIAAADLIVNQYEKKRPHTLEEKLWSKVREISDLTLTAKEEEENEKSLSDKKHQALLNHLSGQLFEVTGSYESSLLLLNTSLAFYGLSRNMAQALMDKDDLTDAFEKIKDLSLIKYYPVTGKDKPGQEFLRPHDDILVDFHQNYWDQDPDFKYSRYQPILEYYELAQNWPPVKPGKDEKYSKTEALQKQMELHYLTYLFEAANAYRELGNREKQIRENLERATRYTQYIFIDNIDQHPDHAGRILAKAEIYLPLDRDRPFYIKKIDSFPFREWLVLRRVEYWLTERNRETEKEAEKQLKELKAYMLLELMKRYKKAVDPQTDAENNAVQKEIIRTRKVIAVSDGYLGELYTWQNKFELAKKYLEKAGHEFYLMGDENLLQWIRHLQGFVYNRSANFEQAILFNTLTIQLTLPYLEKTAGEYLRKRKSSSGNKILFIHDPAGAYRFRQSIRVLLRSLGNLAAIRRYSGNQYYAIKYSIGQIYLWDTIPHPDREIARAYANLLISINTLELEDLVKGLGIYAGTGWLANFDKDDLIELRLKYAKAAYWFKKGGMGYINVYMPDTYAKKMKDELKKEIEIPAKRLALQVEALPKNSSLLAKVKKLLQTEREEHPILRKEAMAIARNIYQEGTKNAILAPQDEFLNALLNGEGKDYYFWEKEKKEEHWQKTLGSLIEQKEKPGFSREVADLYYLQGKIYLQSLDRNDLPLYAKAENAFIKTVVVAERTHFRYLELKALEALILLNLFRSGSFEKWNKAFRGLAFEKENSDSFVPLQGKPKYLDVLGKYHTTIGNCYFQRALKENGKGTDFSEAFDHYVSMLEYGLQHNQDRYDIALKVIASRVTDLVKKEMKKEIEKFKRELAKTEARQKDPHLLKFVEGLSEGGQLAMKHKKNVEDDTIAIRDLEKKLHLFSKERMTRKGMEILRLLRDYYVKKAKETKKLEDIEKAILYYYRFAVHFQYLNQSKKAESTIRDAITFLNSFNEKNRTEVDKIISGNLSNVVEQIKQKKLLPTTPEYLLDILQILIATTRYRTNEFWIVERFVSGEEKYFQERHPDFDLSKSSSPATLLRDAIGSLASHCIKLESTTSHKLSSFYNVLSDGCFRLGELFILMTPEKNNAKELYMKDSEMFETLDKMLQEPPDFTGLINNGHNPYLKYAYELARQKTHDIFRQGEALQSIYNHFYFTGNKDPKRLEKLEYKTKAYCLSFFMLAKLFREGFQKQKGKELQDSKDYSFNLEGADLHLSPDEKKNKASELQEYYQIVTEEFRLPNDLDGENPKTWYKWYNGLKGDSERFHLKETLANLVQHLSVLKEKVFDRSHLNSPFTYAKLKMVMGNEIFSRYFTPEEDIYEQIKDQILEEASARQEPTKQFFGKLLLEKCGTKNEEVSSVLKRAKEEQKEGQLRQYTPLGADMRQMMYHYLEGLDVLCSPLYDSLEFSNYLLEIQRRILLIPDEAAIKKILLTLEAGWNHFPRLRNKPELLREMTWTLTARYIGLCLSQTYENR